MRTFSAKSWYYKKLMPKENSDKNKDVIKELEKTISPILVVNNSSLKPYVELFQYEPENIYQQPLGCLVGFFEVKEFSEDSAYIVNFLTSVLKKEYYINPKREVTESLDSALHKVNMALSELAKHGNIEWLGKINAAICVIEKNNTHFSVSGNAKIFLYRNQNLSEISEGLASESPDPHPLKTFVNVSSGRLEKNDRLMITSEDIFHILPPLEIKKNFQRFEGEKFIQFLRTALSNQMEMIVSIVVEMTEAVPVAAIKTKSNKKAAKTVNVFSEKTFANTIPNDASIEEIMAESEAKIEDIPEPEYTDEKTGHIYVQGEVMESSEGSSAKMSLYWDSVKDKISNGKYVAKNEIRKRFSLYKKQLAKKREQRAIEKEQRELLQAEKNKRLEEERVLQEIQYEQQLAEQAELDRLAKIEEEKNEKILAKERAIQEEIEKREFKAKISAETVSAKQDFTIIPKEAPKKELSFTEKVQLARAEQQRSAVIDLRKKPTVAAPQPEPIKITEPENQFEEENIIKNDFAEKVSNAEKLKNISEKYLKQFSNISTPIITEVKNFSIKILDRSKELEIAPHFSKISKLFSRFSSKQKLYTLAALLIIFIVPIFIVHFSNQPKKPTITDLQIAPVIQVNPLEKEKNITLDAKTQNISSNKEIVTTLIANNNQAIVTKHSVIVLQDGQSKEFPFPNNSATAVRAAFMSDLSLILIVTSDNKVLSFSPAVSKFADNKIDLSNISQTSVVGTYLTYLYVLDQKNNQIYRFPRADGGFGDKTNWLKDNTSLTNVSELTIDDNIYVINDNQVLKFTKGQKQSFDLEATTVPMHFDKIYTASDLSGFYALDTKNARIVKYSKDGKIIAQFENKAFENGTTLAVDEKINVAYIGTPQGLISISLQ